MKEPSKIILHPYVTEKTMGLMDDLNKLEFIVDMGSTKKDIKWAVQELFQVEVAKVNTHVKMDGQKHAIVTFPEGVDAEDVGMRIGIF